MTSPTRRASETATARWGLWCAVLLTLAAGTAGADFQLQGKDLNFSASARRGKGQLFGPQPFLRLEENVRLQFKQGLHRVELRSQRAEARLSGNRRDLTQAEATGAVHVEIWTLDPNRGQPAHITTDCARVLYQAATSEITLYAAEGVPAVIVSQMEGAARDRFELEFSEQFVLDLGEPTEAEASPSQTDGDRNPTG